MNDIKKDGKSCKPDVDETLPPKDVAAGTAIRPGQDVAGTSLGQPVRDYPYAIIWVLVLSFPAYFTTYSPAILSLMIGIPEFQKDFGTLLGDQYIISASAQTMLTTLSIAGQSIGSLCVGIPLNRYGQRKTLAGMLLIFTGFAFMQVFGRSLPILAAGSFFVGLAASASPVLSLAFASGLPVHALSSALSSYTNFAFLAGQTLAAGVGKAITESSVRRAYRIGFVLQFVLPVVLLPCLPFIPESPAWVSRNSSPEEASKVINRLARSGTDTAAASARVLEVHRQEPDGSSIVNCFQGTHLRRTVIGIVCACTIPLCGAFFTGSFNYILILEGMSASNSFSANLGLQAAGLLASGIASVSPCQNKRRAWILRLVACAVTMGITGAIDCVPNRSSKDWVAWVEVAMVTLWYMAYGVLVGPLSMVYIGEIQTAKLRANSIGLAFMVQYGWNIVFTIALPYLWNPDAAYLNGKIDFIFVACATGIAIWSFFEIPELRSGAQMDVLFSQKMKARQIKHCEAFVQGE